MTVNFKSILLGTSLLGSIFNCWISPSYGMEEADENTYLNQTNNVRTQITSLTNIERLIENRSRETANRSLSNHGRSSDDQENYSSTQTEQSPEDWYKQGLSYKKEKSYEMAHECFFKAAEKNYASAQGQLGNLYAYGLGVNHDYTKAMEYYKKGAKAGHSICQRKVGVFYANGLGVERNYKKAKKWYGRAADNNDAVAQYKLGNLYNKGHGVEQNVEKALFWCFKSVQNNHSKVWSILESFYKRAQMVAHSNSEATDQDKESAYYLLGYLHEKLPELDSGKAISFYEKSKDPRAYIRLGKMYLNGKGKAKCNLLALLRFQNAANQDNSDGKYYVGLMSLQGKGFQTMKPLAALDSFSKAAERNHPKALFQLGIMKQFGIGTEKSYKEAREFYEKSGTASAYYYLGNLYKQGLGVESNIENALKFWERAAGAGHREAAYMAGKICFLLCDDKNDASQAEKAYKYLKKAADLNHTDAIDLLNSMQGEGIGCEENSTKSKIILKRMKEAVKNGDKRAIKWFVREASKDNASVQRYFGKLREQAIHLPPRPQDMLVAIYFYKQAASKGNRSAQRRLDDFKKVHILDALGIE